MDCMDVVVAYGVAVHGVGRPGLTYGFASRPRTGRVTGHGSKLVKCLIPPARQLELTRRGDLLKAGAMQRLPGLTASG